MRSRLARLVLFLWASAAQAGPPYLTDDPEPTDTGHWEIYAPLVEGEGHGRDVSGSAGVKINYGLMPDVQLTVGLPVSFARDEAGWRHGAGDVAVSTKYRFYQDEGAGVSIAIFPGVTLPTAANGMGSGRVTGLLPVWVQKDSGPWSVFGGGGYATNPGAGNRDFWTGGVAVTRSIGERLQLGVEADWQAADVEGGSGTTSLGIGATYRLRAPFRLLASGGPAFARGVPTGFHAFMALGADF